MEIRLLKDYGSDGEVYKAGDDLKVSQELAEKLIADGFAQSLDSIKDAEAKTAEIERIAVKTVDTAIKKLADTGKIVASVKEAPEDKMRFKGLYDQLDAVYKARNGDTESVSRLNAVVKIAAATGLNEGINSEGGFLVQTDIQAELESRAMETGKLLARTQMTVLSGPSNALEYNEVNDYDRTDGNRMGGITVSRTHEAAASSASKPSLKRQRIEAEKLTGLFYATEELLQDATALAGEVTNWFGSEFGYKIDDEIVNGNGGGEMLGILNSPALVVVPKVSAQIADTIVVENLDAMFSRMWAPSIASGNARWYINQDIIPQLLELSQDVGTGGSVLFRRGGNISEAPFGTILGIAIEPIEQCQTLGDEGDIILADLSQYKTVTKGGLVSQSSMHVKFVEGETAFRFTQRINGQPKWSNVLTPANSSATRSPFVTLAERGA